MSLVIDGGKCMSVKRKDLLVQCSHKPIKNSVYCGIHIKCKQIKRIDEIVGIPEMPEIAEITPITAVPATALLETMVKLESIVPVIGHRKKSDKRVKILGLDDESPYELAELADYPMEFIRLNRLKNTFIHLNIKCPDLKEFNGKEKCRILYNQLYQHYLQTKKYGHLLGQIVKIQSVVRGFLVRRRHKCINWDDFYTLDNKYETPSKYYFHYSDPKKYFFDVRSFAKILEGKHIINPYTMQPIPDEAIERFHKRMTHLQAVGDKLNVEQGGIISDDQKFVLSVIDIFHKYDVLDNYTDYRWFLNLSLEQLKRFYIFGEDIWNYRAQLTPAEKKNIIKDKAFALPISYIKSFKPNHKRKLQNIILEEMDKFVSHGVNTTERKLGSMLMLTVLVEVSPEAAYALPYLVQQAFS